MSSPGFTSSRSFLFIVLVALVIFRPVSFAQENRAASLRVIVIPSADEAAALRARIATGESFHVLALRHSIDESAARGGDMGVLSLSDLRAEYRDALEAAVDGLTPVAAVDGTFVILQWVPELETEWRRLREQGIEAAAAGRYAAAGDLFLQALEVAETFGEDDPRLAESLNDVAEIRRREGREEDAIPYYERAIAVWDSGAAVGTPALATSLTNLAGIRTRQDRFVEAERLYRRAVASWTETLGAEHLNVAGARSSLAQVLDAQGRYDEAVDLYRQALAIRERAFGPRGAEVTTTLADLAAALVRAERSADAVSAYERLLGLVWTVPTGSGDPDPILRTAESLVDVISRSLIGESRARGTLLDNIRHPEIGEPLPLAAARLLVSVGLSAEADDLLTAAIGRFPDSRAARYERAALREDTGRIGDAIVDLTVALELGGSGPGDGILLRILGNHHAELGNLEEALEFYERAVETDPSDAATHTGRGILLKLMFQPGRAREAFRQAVRLDPQSTDALVRLAELELDSGRFSEALRTASEAVAIDSGNEQARYIRARALIQDGRRDEGSRELEAYQEAADDSRDREASLLERTVVERDVVRSLRDQNIDAALDTLESGIASFAADGRLYLIRAVLLKEAGRTGEAIDALEAMIEAGVGDDSVIHRSLERLYASTGDAVLKTRHRARFLERIRTELEAQRPAYLPPGR